MSRPINSLTRTPLKRERLSGHLCPTYEESEIAAHKKAWEPYLAFGIQPNCYGVQVYHQPQSAAAIRMVAEALLEIAGRMETP